MTQLPEAGGGDLEHARALHFHSVRQALGRRHADLASTWIIIVNADGIGATVVVTNEIDTTRSDPFNPRTLPKSHGERSPLANLERYDDIVSLLVRAQRLTLAES